MSNSFFWNSIEYHHCNENYQCQTETNQFDTCQKGKLIDKQNYTKNK